MRLIVLISMLVWTGISCGGWNLSTAEEKELLTQTVHCQFVGRLRITSDCFSDIDEVFDRLVFIASKDEIGRAVFPYRIRMERNGVAKEAFCYIADELDWKSKTQSILSERNLILGNCVTNSFDRSNPSMAAVLVAGETNGVKHIEIRPPDTLLGKVMDRVEVLGNEDLEHIPYFGDVVRQHWTDWDHELILQRNRSELMRTAGTKKRICAWAVYSAGGVRDTRRWLKDTVKRRKSIKIRVWDEGVDMNRANALCVASIALECSDGGLQYRGLEVERGGESLTINCGVGAHGAGVSIIFDEGEIVIFP